MSAPAWVEVTEWHICDGSRPSSGPASDQANWWAKPVPATTTDRSDEGHAEAAGSVESHIGSPTPSLVVLYPGAPQRHSQIRRSEQIVRGHPSPFGPSVKPREMVQIVSLVPARVAVSVAVSPAHDRYF